MKLVRQREIKRIENLLLEAHQIIHAQKQQMEITNRAYGEIQSAYMIAARAAFQIAKSARIASELGIDLMEDLLEAERQWERAVVLAEEHIVSE